jgi:hypothetical protein
MMAGGMYITEDKLGLPGLSGQQVSGFQPEQRRISVRDDGKRLFSRERGLTEDLIRMLGEPTPFTDKTAVWRMKSIIPAFQ